MISVLSTCKQKVLGLNPARVKKIFRPLVHLAYTVHALGWDKMEGSL